MKIRTQFAVPSVLLCCISLAASETPWVQDASLSAMPSRAPTLAQNADVDDFIRYAILNNPALAAARQRLEAVRQTIPQAGAWPDPRLSYGHFLEEVETRVGPQQRLRPSGSTWQMPSRPAN